MIYNFAQYLRNLFPAELFYVNMTTQNAGQDEIPDRKTLVQQQGGVRQMKTGFSRVMVQVATFDIDSVLSRRLSYDIFEEIRDRNGQLLPAVTVNGTVYPQVETGAIKAMSPPQFLTTDQAALAVWTTNYQITFVEA